MSKRTSTRTLSAFPLERAWAMEEGQLTALTRAIESALSADRDGLAQIRQTLSMTRREARQGDRPENGYTVENGIGFYSFEGVVTKNPTCYGAFFGGDAVTSDAVDAFNAMRQDATVREAVVRIDSPGGSVDGTAECADALRALAAAKPVTAYVDGLAASGAYWIASQASRVVINNATARVGSIGVFAVIPDTSRAYENAGVRVHVVKAGEGKGSGTSGVPVTPDVLAEVQREVSALYEEFVAAVALGRGIPVEQARALADGRVHVGRAALALGLVDGIASLEDVMGGIPRAIEEQPPQQGDETRASARQEEPMTKPRSEEAPPEEAAPEGATMEERMDALEMKAAAQDQEIADVKSSVSALEARIAALEGDGEEEPAEEPAEDAAAERLIADFRGENGGPVRLAAMDEDGAGIVRSLVASQGADKARAYLTATLAVIGKGVGTVATHGAKPAVATARNHFDAFGPAKWAGSPDPVMQAYGRKIEWIDAAEKSGRKFRTAAEAFAAYGAAHKSAA